jgi:hypothetical protein
MGIIGSGEPLAQALLGAAENEEVEVVTAQGLRTATVLAIERVRESVAASVPLAPPVRQPVSAVSQTAPVASGTPDRTQPVYTSLLLSVRLLSPCPARL